jgi:hypothetical protein
MNTATHHIGSSRPQIVERGTNVGSKAIEAGWVVYLKESDASSPTVKFGRNGVSSAWEPASDAALVDLEQRKFGIAKTAAAVGADFEVYVSGDMIPAKLLTTGGEVSILAGAPLMVDATVATGDDELITRAFAVTKTGLEQPIRFKSSTTQTTTASTVNTIYVDVYNPPVGYFTGS